MEQGLPKKPGVFSISAASIVAFQLGAHECRGRDIREMLTFGGYVDWSESLIFSLDGKIDEDDKVKIGSPYPDFTLGFTGDLSYKGFDLNLFIYWNHGNEIFNTVLQIPCL